MSPLGHFERFLCDLLRKCGADAYDIIELEDQMVQIQIIIKIYKTMYVKGVTDASQIHKIAQNLFDIVSEPGGTLFAGPHRPENWKLPASSRWWATYRRAERQLGLKKSANYRTDRFNWLVVVLWRLTAGDYDVSRKYQVTVTVCDMGKLPFETNLIVDGPESLYDGHQELFVAIVNLLAVGSMSEVTVTQL